MAGLRRHVDAVSRVARPGRWGVTAELPALPRARDALWFLVPCPPGSAQWAQWATPYRKLAELRAKPET